jgi:flagellin
VAFNIKDRGLQANLERQLSRAQRENADSLEKLSSGTVFSKNDPKPAERALAEGLEFKLRSLASSKRNITSAVSLLQTAESSLSELANMVIRMKEINIAAANTTVSDKERRFLFIEYQALHDEINRIAETTNFNGIPLLNGNDPTSPEELVFRLGDPQASDGEAIVDIEDDINVLRFDGLKKIVATAEGLGLHSAKELLLDASDEEGIAIEDVEELMAPEDSDLFDSAYDEAMDLISTARAVFGGMQARLQRSMDHIDVYQENLTAAKSSIADVDYAKEVSRMVETRMLVQAGTAVLAQGNINSALALNLLKSID